MLWSSGGVLPKGEATRATADIATPLPWSCIGMCPQYFGSLQKYFPSQDFGPQQKYFPRCAVS